MPKPNYITYGGDITMQPPFQLDRPSMYSFWLKSDCSKLQKILDTRLNFTNNDKRYVPFTSSVMLIFAETPHAYSGSDREEGFITMNEAVFWILAVEQEKEGDKWKSKRLVWFIPYIFVDNPVELIAGREVAGYPKALGQIIMPKDHHYTNSFVINPSSFAKFGINSEFMVNRLLSIDNQSPQTNFEKEFRTMTEAKKALKSSLGNFRNFLSGTGLGICNEAINGIGDAVRLFESFISDILTAEMPAVFLKQFRSASNDGKACYQAIIESAFTVNGFHGARLLKASDYTLTINDLDSFPIAKELGLVTGQQPSHALWLNLSFANTSGKEIWVAE